MTRESDPASDNAPEPGESPKRKTGWLTALRKKSKKAYLVGFGAIALTTHATAFYTGNHIEPVGPPNMVWSISKGTTIRYDPEDPEPYDEVMFRPVSQPIRHSRFRSCETELRRLNPDARLGSIDLINTTSEKSLVYRVTYRIAQYQHENWVVPCTVRIGGAASIHF